jgi:hypothetical protein
VHRFLGSAGGLAQDFHRLRATGWTAGYFLKSIRGFLQSGLAKKYSPNLAVRSRAGGVD